MPSTLSSLATYQEDIKKSRFIALADKVDSPAQALDFFAAHSVADATHNCWAYRIGDEYRFNDDRSEEHTSELQSLMRISYAVFCLKKKQNKTREKESNQTTLE